MCESLSCIYIIQGDQIWEFEKVCGRSRIYNIYPTDAAEEQASKTDMKSTTWVAGCQSQLFCFGGKDEQGEESEFKPWAAIFTLLTVNGVFVALMQPLPDMPIPLYRPIGIQVGYCILLAGGYTNPQILPTQFSPHIFEFNTLTYKWRNLEVKLTVDRVGGKAYFALDQKTNLPGVIFYGGENFVASGTLGLIHQQIDVLKITISPSGLNTYQIENKVWEPVIIPPVGNYYSLVRIAKQGVYYVQEGKLKRSEDSN